MGSDIESLFWRSCGILATNTTSGPIYIVGPGAHFTFDSSHYGNKSLALTLKGRDIKL